MSTQALLNALANVDAPTNDISFHQGIIVAWNATNSTNAVDVAGSIVYDLPVLTSAGLIALGAGDPVAILKYKSTYFILGRVVALTSQLVEPLFPDRKSVV